MVDPELPVTPRLPDRIYLRWARFSEPPTDAEGREAWLRELDRTGRLIAEGSADGDDGRFLLIRARDRGEAARALRTDPFQGTEVHRTVSEWSIDRLGTGVNVEPPPPRGAGRLTVLHRISVFVRDQAEALAWYRETLGLLVREHDASTEYVELSLGPGAAGLVLVRPRPDWGIPLYEEGRRRIGIPTGITFRTDNVEALALRLAHAGHPPREGPRTEPWGGRSLRFADPDGNEFLAVDDGGAPPARRPAPARRPHRRRGSPPTATSL